MATIIIDAKQAFGKCSSKLESHSITVSKIPLEIIVTTF